MGAWSEEHRSEERTRGHTEEFLFRGYLIRRACDVWEGAPGRGWYRVHRASLLSGCLWAANHLPSPLLLALHSAMNGLFALSLTRAFLPEMGTS